MLLHGALVISNFDGLGSKNLDYYDFSDYGQCHRPLGPLVVDFASAELF